MVVETVVEIVQVVRPKVEHNRVDLLLDKEVTDPIIMHMELDGGGGGYYGGYGGVGANDSGDNQAGGGGSGYVNTAQLTSTQTIAGNQSFPSPTSSSNETGHAGNGYARITPVN